MAEASKRQYTLIFVPHAEARFRKLHFSRRVLGVMGALTALGIVLTGALGFHYIRFHSELTELRQLRLINADLRRQNLDYEVSSEHLNKRVSNLQDFVKKLSVMAGLDTTVFGEPTGGVGGPHESDVLDSAYAQVKESLELMAGDMSSLEEKSRVLERFYEQNSLMLASTPSIWPVRGYLSSTFGTRNDPFTGKRTHHPGLDISTPIGRAVVASADGIVLYSSRRGSYGNTVVIDHKFGVMTLYAHLSGFESRVGRRVKRGDVIGYVGSTGRSRGPHLHYEVWVGDQVVHPLNYILEYAKTFNEKTRNRRRGSTVAP